jgi:wyosine [tRNA(Phe)-imidazoG37] synthetase (radical SAM superfamily)
MLLSPKPGILYGPVASRRLGFSLGINLLPPREKPCTFDCVYCQYGWTKRAPMPGDAFPSVDQVLTALEAELAHPQVAPAFLTFSGNGEPTTHPQFRAVVEGVRALRDHLLPHAKLAVLSNSTRVFDPMVRQALALLDMRIMKLDAGSEAVFQRYCRPLEPVTLEQVVAGLAALRHVTLQALFTGGPGGNADPAHVQGWIDKVVRIAPLDIQIYTLDRSWPSHKLVPLETSALEIIAQAARDAGCRATVFPAPARAIRESWPTTRTAK